MPQHGTFAWNELLTSDVEAAKRFYEETIGWTFAEMPMPNGAYHVASVDGKYAAGIMNPADVGEGDVPPNWFAYLEVDDVDKRVERARAAGAVVKREPWDIPGVGRVAILQQPDGATVGWMTSASQTAQQ
jgi:predicted enzyme related to lactoylglutathione lyase